jgi:hypothetical protein
LRLSGINQYKTLWVSLCSAQVFLPNPLKESQIKPLKFIGRARFRAALLGYRSR